jgi:hypothetical protein
MSMPSGQAASTTMGTCSEIAGARVRRILRRWRPCGGAGVVAGATRGAMHVSVGLTRRGVTLESGQWRCVGGPSATARWSSGRARRGATCPDPSKRTWEGARDGGGGGGDQRRYQQKKEFQEYQNATVNAASPVQKQQWHTQQKSSPALQDGKPGLRRESSSIPV